MDDEQLLALKKSGGVIQIVAYNGFVKITEPDSAERAAALAAGAKMNITCPMPHSPGQRARLASRVERIVRRRSAPNTKEASPRSTSSFPATRLVDLKDFVDHIDYAVKLIGIDHVGISSDFDGGGGVVGWNDASETFNVTLELVRRGYTEEQIEKLWSGNLLRVMDEVQRVASGLQQ